MDAALFVEQILNGVQAGVMLFLMAAGLTLVFGIMGLINLNHGTLFMAGALVAAKVVSYTGSFWLGVVVAIAFSGALGVLLETTVFRKLYNRDHLDQVLATYALILFFNGLARAVFGRQPYQIDFPQGLGGSVHLFGDLEYPVYRLLIIMVGVVVAAFIHLLVTKTRIGMLIRAGSTHREMISALGVNIVALFTGIFAVGACLAGLAGSMIGPLQAVEIGMGEDIVILAFVVIVIGGIGSIRGALVGSLLVGIVDALGRTLVPLVLSRLTDAGTVASLSGAFASIGVYVILAMVLLIRPNGLFAGRV